MIVSFGDRATEDLYHNRPTSRARRFPQDFVGWRWSSSTC